MGESFPRTRLSQSDFQDIPNLHNLARHHYTPHSFTRRSIAMSSHDSPTTEMPVDIIEYLMSSVGSRLNTKIVNDRLTAVETCMASNYNPDVVMSEVLKLITARCESDDPCIVYLMTYNLFMLLTNANIRKVVLEGSGKLVVVESLKEVISTYRIGSKCSMGRSFVTNHEALVDSIEKEYFGICTEPKLRIREYLKTPEGSRKDAEYHARYCKDLAEIRRYSVMTYSTIGSWLVRDLKHSETWNQTWQDRYLLSYYALSLLENTDVLHAFYSDGYNSSTRSMCLVIQNLVEHISHVPNAAPEWTLRKNTPLLQKIAKWYPVLGKGVIVTNTITPENEVAGYISDNSKRVWAPLFIQH